MGRAPPGSAGVPPARVLAQPRPTPQPGSNGNGARTLLRPSLCRFRRQSGRAPHRRETERHATGVHAGGTPALPGGLHPLTSSQQRRSIGTCVYLWFLFNNHRQFLPPMIRPVARSGARTLLRPSQCRFRRQGGRAPHRRETERHRTGVHAGGTPALPGGLHPLTSSQQTRSIGTCVYLWFLFNNHRQFLPPMIRPVARSGAEPYPPPHQPSPFGSASATPPPGGSDTPAPDAGLCHSPLEGESVRPGLRPQSNRWGGRNRRDRQIGDPARGRAGGGSLSPGLARGPCFILYDPPGRAGARLT